MHMTRARSNHVRTRHVGPCGREAFRESRIPECLRSRGVPRPVRDHGGSRHLAIPCGFRGVVSSARSARRRHGACFGSVGQSVCWSCGDSERTGAGRGTWRGAHGARMASGPGAGAARHRRIAGGDAGDAPRSGVPGLHREHHRVRSRHRSLRGELGHGGRPAAAGPVRPVPHARHARRNGDGESPNRVRAGGRHPWHRLGHRTCAR